ncbi:MAG: hypothetical protein ACYCST_15400 [Acidimicrobiales bacterium]
MDVDFVDEVVIWLVLFLTVVVMFAFLLPSSCSIRCCSSASSGSSSSCSSCDDHVDALCLKAVDVNVIQ